MRLERIIGELDKAKCDYGAVGALEIERLSADSRERCDGALFFSLKSEKTGVKTHEREAIEKGAVAVVCERKSSISAPQIVVSDVRATLARAAGAFYGYPAERMKIIAITGTNGKTTTAHMLAAVLRAWGKKVGVIGTLGAEYEGKRLDTGLTTPDPIALQKLLAEMAARDVEYIVMEASAHALYFRKLAGMRFAACIFTNLTQDHLDFFPSMSAYGGAKSKLFVDDSCPIAVLNGDDEFGRRLGKNRTGETIYYGLRTPSEAFAVPTNERIDGTDFLLNISDRLGRVRLALTGRHNIYNALAAASCAVALGADMGSVCKGLSSLEKVQGRLERVATYAGADIFVDFAHTPDGLEQSLSALKSHCSGRLICLFGCGGNRDKTKRAPMGEAVAKRCDFGILTSDNPRYEDPLDILAEVERGYRRFSVKYVVVPEREAAIRYAVDFLAAGDILLVAGKGGEEYQEIMGIKYPFNDNDIIGKILREKGVERDTRV